MSKDKGGLRRKVFTATGPGFRVKCDVVLGDLKQALALRAIITSFETSALKRGNGGKNLG